MKTMEKKASVKTPTYALVHGTGMFAATRWMCKKCGRQLKFWLYGNTMPNPQQDGRCPDTLSGNHVWVQF